MSWNITSLRVQPSNCSRFILHQYDDKFKSKLKEITKIKTVYFLLALVNNVNIANISNIEDKVIEYENCGICQMENTQNHLIFFAIGFQCRGLFCIVFSISPKHAKMKYRGSEIDKTSIMCLYYLENLKSKNLILILFWLTFCILILLMIFFYWNLQMPLQIDSFNTK